MKQNQTVSRQSGQTQQLTRRSLWCAGSVTEFSVGLTSQCRLPAIVCFPSLPTFSLSSTFAYHRIASFSTMVMFTGRALGKIFASREAEDPYDLCRQLLPSGEPHKDYRMWIELSYISPGNKQGDKHWFDINLALGSKAIFVAFLKAWDGDSELYTIIRSANAPAPKSSSKHPPEFIDKTREEQLINLKQRVDLFDRVRYWIADIVDYEKFENASIRLGQRIEVRRVSNFMTSYYFSNTEAQDLHNLWIPESTVCLKTFLEKLDEEASSNCSSRNLASRLLRIFAIEKNFFKDPSFQEEREEWIKISPSIVLGPAHRTNIIDSNNVIDY